MNEILLPVGVKLIVSTDALKVVPEIKPVPNALLSMLTLSNVLGPTTLVAVPVVMTMPLSKPRMPVPPVNVLEAAVAPVYVELLMTMPLLPASSVLASVAALLVGVTMSESACVVGATKLSMTKLTKTKGSLFLNMRTLLEVKPKTLRIEC
ncbi:MAG: hypothetical protein M3430_00520 [Acidobacteriota bacterium]|nr:hypothetical protein [Acidobacteriota bacterium]